MINTVLPTPAPPNSPENIKIIEYPNELQI
jgi:hypothetical protein